MNPKTKAVLILATVLCLPGIAAAQDTEMINVPRFKLFAGITYNQHFLGHPDFESTDMSTMSHFPGVEFGFTIFPKDNSGWRLDYRNTFLAELALYEIFDEFSSPQESIFGDVVNRTVNNGFLGRLDIGKRLTGSENRSFSAGFIVSDKVMLGTDSEIPYYIYGPEESVTNTGFHFTPGLFASYDQHLIRAGEFSVRLAFTQSLFNLHQFGDSAIEHYTLPLFTEVDINLRLPSGIYFLTGAILATSFSELPADARVRIGIGYTFRK